MPADEYDQARLTAIFVRENDVEEALEEARQDVLLWIKRGRLAVKHDRQDLAREAKARAAAAKQRFLDAQTELSSIAAQKNRIRREARRPDGEETFRAEMLAEQFKIQGFDPAEQEIKEVFEDAEAEMDLAEMKGEPVEPLVPEVTETDGALNTPSEPAESVSAPVQDQGPSPTAPATPTAPSAPPNEDVESAALAELEELKAIARAAGELEASDDDIAAIERELAALRDDEKGEDPQ